MKPIHIALAISIATFTPIIMADDETKEMTNAETALSDEAACALPSHAQTTALDAFKKSDSEWKKILTDEQFRVMRQHGTEPPFRNAFWNNKEAGIYVGAGCKSPLFASAHKYNSGTGWPSFYDTIAPENIGQTVDKSYGMVRTEVHSSRCGGHLGHVFPDGPQPTGLRYCINSASLEFVPRAEMEERGFAAYLDYAK